MAYRAAPPPPCSYFFFKYHLTEVGRKCMSAGVSSLSLGCAEDGASASPQRPLPLSALCQSPFLSPVRWGCPDLQPGLHPRIPSVLFSVPTCQGRILIPHRETTFLPRKGCRYGHFPGRPLFFLVLLREMVRPGANPGLPGPESRLTLPCRGVKSSPIPFLVLYFPRTFFFFWRSLLAYMGTVARW